MMLFGVMLLAFSLCAIVPLVLVNKCFITVSAHEALIINRSNGRTLVSFTGSMVIPIIHKAETMDMRVKLVRISRSADDPTPCKSGETLVMDAVFYVRVNTTGDDVIKVANAIGCKRASDPETLENLFTARFSEAIKVVARASTFDKLRKNRESLLDSIIGEVGRDLNGYIVDDLAITRLEAAQRPVS